MKVCFKCGAEKPLSNFYKHKGMLDGHLNKCKTCAKSDSNQHYHSNRKNIRQKRQGYEQSMWGRYLVHKSHAKKRGIDFLITFEEWRHIWLMSGKWDKRGNQAGSYAMCRTGDIGPYATGNVRIDTIENNAREVRKNYVCCS